MAGDVPQLLAQKAHAARPAVQQSRHGVQSGGFACAVGANERHHLPRLHMEGYILHGVDAVSAAGSLGRSHYVNGKFIASNLCLVLTSKHDPKYPIDLEFYNCYFASIKKQIVSDLADGTSKLTISPDMFKDYYIDYIPYEEQQDFVKTKLKGFLSLQEKYRKAQEQLSHDIANLSD